MRSMSEPIMRSPFGSRSLQRAHRWVLSRMALRRWARSVSRRARKAPPFIGPQLRQRPLLQAPERWSLVGIESLEPQRRLRGGSILFAATDDIVGHGRGYITSVTWSP